VRQARSLGVGPEIGSRADSATSLHLTELPTCCATVTHTILLSLASSGLDIRTYLFPDLSGFRSCNTLPLRTCSLKRQRSCISLQQATVFFERQANSRTRYCSEYAAEPGNAAKDDGSILLSRTFNGILRPHCRLQSF